MLADQRHELLDQRLDGLPVAHFFDVPGQHPQDGFRGLGLCLGRRQHGTGGHMLTGTEAGPLPELPQTLDKKDKNKISRGPDRRRSEPPRVVFYNVKPMS